MPPTAPGRPITSTHGYSVTATTTLTGAMIHVNVSPDWRGEISIPITAAQATELLRIAS